LTGKSKSCFFAAVLCLHCGLKRTAFEAISFVNAQKGENVFTSPSLTRYVYYYERLLRQDRVPAQSLSLAMLRMNTIPRCSSSIINSGCTPSILVRQRVRDDGNNQRQQQLVTDFFKPFALLSASREYTESSDDAITFNLQGKNLILRGDVCLMFYNNGDELIAQVCFHTAFVGGSYLHFEKVQVDHACDDLEHRLFDKSFSVDLVAQQAVDDPRRSIAGEASDDYLRCADTACG
jgi:hypothetical protein